MPINFQTYNTGRDLTVTIIDNATGVTLVYGGYITEFNATGEHDIASIKPIDQPNDVNHISYGNYRITITVERATGDLMRLEAANRADYNRDGTTHLYTITGTYRNQADKSQDKFQWLSCLLYLEDQGAARKDQSMPQRLMATCADFVAL